MATMQVNNRQNVSSWTDPRYPYSPQSHYRYPYPQTAPAPGYHWPVTPPAPSNYTVPEPIVPRDNDILMGRGGKNNMFFGNEQLRTMARAMRDRYNAASKKEKSAMSRELVKQVQALSPPGRFLKREDVTAAWEEVDIASAREKASQCLRDAVKPLKPLKSDPKDSPSKQEKRKGRSPAPVSPDTSRPSSPEIFLEAPEMPPLALPRGKRARIGTWEVDSTSSMMNSDLGVAVMDFVNTLPVDDPNNFVPVIARPEEWDLFNFNDDAVDDPLLVAEPDMECDGDDGTDPFGTDFY